MAEELASSLAKILTHYKAAFSRKVYQTQEDEPDLLMSVFGISAALKRENAQYWGRELGICWQRLVVELCKQRCSDFGPPLRLGADEPCDLIVGSHAIDTKYRIGSGDSGTLKKFKANAQWLQEKGYLPVLLIVREDNLPSAINACKVGGWTVFTGAATYEYIFRATNFDLAAYLSTKAWEYKIER